MNGSEARFSGLPGRRLWLFACKTYVLVLPAVVLLCYFFQNDPGILDLGTSRILARENSAVFNILGLGYLTCILTFFIGAIAHDDKKMVRSDMLFAFMSILSLLVFYLLALITPTRH